MEIPQLNDTLSLDSEGNINWEDYYLKYNPDLYYPGKKITSEEFNKLIIQSAAQTNYLTKTLKDLFVNKFDGAVSRKVTGLFNLKQSFFKTFTPADWGTQHADGYYYIVIQPQEHGYTADVEPSIDTEMYVVDPNDDKGAFYEVSQIYTSSENVVTLYTDVPCLGYVTIRSNMRAAEYNANKVDAANIIGLHPVAITGDYNSLSNRPNYDTSLQALTQKIQDLVDGNTIVPKSETSNRATYATILDDQGVVDAQLGRYKLKDIFETIGPIAKQATRAHNLNYTKTFTTTIQANNPALPEISTPTSTALKSNTWYAVNVSRRDISGVEPIRAHIGSFFFQTKSEFTEEILHTFPTFYNIISTTNYALKLTPRGSDYTYEFDLCLYRVLNNTAFHNVQDEYDEADEWCTWEITINEIPLVLMEE